MLDFHKFGLKIIVINISTNITEDYITILIVSLKRLMGKL